MNIEESVIQALDLYLDPSKKFEITSSTYLIDDLGLDSLDITELTLRLEEKYDITFPDDTGIMVRTVQDVVDAIKKELDKFKMGKIPQEPEIPFLGKVTSWEPSDPKKHLIKHTPLDLKPRRSIFSLTNNNTKKIVSVSPNSDGTCNIIDEDGTEYLRCSLVSVGSTITSDKNEGLVHVACTFEHNLGNAKKAIDETKKEHPGQK